MHKYALDYPDKTHLYSIGRTVENRELWVMAISSTKPAVHVPLRPEVKYIGNMHGNEVPSKEILVNLIEYLLENPDDPDVALLLNSTRIHVILF